MLEHAAEMTDDLESGLEATAIVADPVAVAVLHLNPGREPTPPRARRMRDHRPRPLIEPRVPGLVPRVDALEPVVGAAGLDEQSRDHGRQVQARQDVPPRESRYAIRAL